MSTETDQAKRNEWAARLLDGILKSVQVHHLVRCGLSEVTRDYLIQYANGIAPPVVHAVGEETAKCDICGSPVDGDGCTNDRSHSIPVQSPEREGPEEIGDVEPTPETIDRIWSNVQRRINSPTVTESILNHIEKTLAELGWDVSNGGAVDFIRTLAAERDNLVRKAASWEHNCDTALTHRINEIADLKAKLEACEASHDDEEAAHLETLDMLAAKSGEREGPVTGAEVSAILAEWDRTGVTGRDQFIADRINARLSQRGGTLTVEKVAAILAEIGVTEYVLKDELATGGNKEWLSPEMFAVQLRAGTNAALGRGS